VDEMNGTSSRALIIGLAAAALWLGCGVDDQGSQRPRMGRAQTRLAAMSLEERKAATAHQDDKAPAIFVRKDGMPATDEEARMAYRACRYRLLDDRGYISSSGMTRLVALMSCMDAAGWTLTKGAKIDLGDGEAP